MSSCLLTPANVFILCSNLLKTFTGKMIRTWNMEKLMFKVTKTAIMAHNRDMNLQSTHEDYWYIFICVTQQRCSPSDTLSDSLSDNQALSWKLLKLIVTTVHLPVLATLWLFCSSGGYTVDIAVILSPILSLGNTYVPKVQKLGFLCRINTREAAIWVKPRKSLTLFGAFFM